MDLSEVPSQLIEGCLTVDYQRRFGIVFEQTVSQCILEYIDVIELLLEELSLMLCIENPRQDMPGVESLSIWSFDIKRGNLVFWLEVGG
jgi:hypothetical protein